jgi:hypothetical protein
MNKNLLIDDYVKFVEQLERDLENMDYATCEDRASLLRTLRDDVCDRASYLRQHAWTV